MSGRSKTPPLEGASHPQPTKPGTVLASFYAHPRNEPLFYKDLNHGCPRIDPQ